MSCSSKWHLEKHHEFLYFFGSWSFVDRSVLLTRCTTTRKGQKMLDSSFQFCLVFMYFLFYLTFFTTTLAPRLLTFVMSSPFGVLGRGEVSYFQIMRTFFFFPSQLIHPHLVRTFFFHSTFPWSADVWQMWFVDRSISDRCYYRELLDLYECYYPSLDLWQVLLLIVRMMYEEYYYRSPMLKHLSVDLFTMWYCLENPSLSSELR